MRTIICLWLCDMTEEYNPVAVEEGVQDAPQDAPQEAPQEAVVQDAPVAEEGQYQEYQEETQVPEGAHNQAVEDPNAGYAAPQDAYQGGYDSVGPSEPPQDAAPPAYGGEQQQQQAQQSSVQLFVGGLDGMVDEQMLDDFFSPYVHPHTTPAHPLHHTTTSPQQRQ